MRHKVLTLVGSLCLVSALAIWPSTAAFAKDKPIKLTCSYLFPAVNWVHTDAMEPWARTIERRTGGKVKITLYPGSTLAKPGHMYDAVLSGTCDIAFEPGAYYMGITPLGQGILLPFLGSKSAQVLSHALWDLYQEMDALKKEFSEVQLLSAFTFGPGHLHAKKPIRAMEDIKGLIIRAPGAISNTVKALGGSPVSMPAPEMYLSMQKGTLDATIFDWVGVGMHKVNEVAEYHTEAGFYQAWFWVIMNSDTWNRLPRDVQKVFTEESGGKLADIVGRNSDKQDKLIRQKTLDMGQDIIQLSPEEMARWKKQCRPVVDAFVADMKKKGKPGEEYYKRLGQLIDKYNKMF